MALAIGANSAIFTIINALLLRSLPVKNPQQLVELLTQPQRAWWSNPLWEQLRGRDRQLFDGAFAFTATRFDLARGGEVQPVNGMMASGEVFDVLGVPAIAGRTFGLADDLPRGGKDGPVAVISYNFWQRHYGGSRDAVGSQLSLERVNFTVIGITPATFTGLDQGTDVDVIIPVGTQPLIRDSLLNVRGSSWLTVIARLKPDQTLPQAVIAFRSVQRQMREATLPDHYRNVAQYLQEPFNARPAANGPNSLGRQYREPLYVLMLIVVLVLLIACANIANLLLARENANRHDLSVRLALGASPGRIARQLLVESLLLSAIGAALGTVFGRWGAALLVRGFAAYSSSIALDVGLDWHVVAFTGTVATATAVLFGLWPALRGARVDPGDALQAQGRAIVGESRFGFGSLLVIGQITLSLVLVAGAGLFVRTFISVSTLPLGFDAAPMLQVRLDAKRSRSPAERHLELFERVREAVAAAPGVQHAALETVAPVTGQNWDMVLANPPGRSLPEGDRDVYINAVSPDWFKAYGTSLIAGRDFTLHDDVSAPHVAIVSEMFAKRYFPTGNAVGQIVTFQRLPDETWPSLRMVGIARDGVYDSPRDPIHPTLYVPVAQIVGTLRTIDWMTLAVRAAGGRPERLSSGIVAAVRNVDPDLTLRIRPVRADLQDATMRERLLAMLSGSFGALALLLAGIGVYGTMSYTVSRRRSEIGIRIALGANPGSAVRLILVRVAVVIGAGIAGGVVLSMWASRFIGTLLFGLTSRDPETLAGAAVVLALTGGVAAWLPARRAARIDPARALRAS